jgi:heme/copper-type cytochrome/quinol oxidase subunit 2
MGKSGGGCSFIKFLIPIAFIGLIVTAVITLTGSKDSESDSRGSFGGPQEEEDTDLTPIFIAVGIFILVCIFVVAYTSKNSTKKFQDFKSKDTRQADLTNA